MVNGGYQLRYRGSGIKDKGYTILKFDLYPENIQEQNAQF